MAGNRRIVAQRWQDAASAAGRINQRSKREMVDGPDRPDDDMLLAYVRGELGNAEARRVDREAARNPDLAADIALMRGLRAATRDAARENAPPGEMGWARLSRAIDAERRRDRGTSGWPAEIFRMAAAAAIAVAVWQFAITPYLLPGQDGPARYETVTESPFDSMALRVAFNPEATEAEIRALLQEIDAEMTGGPGAIGLWTLSFNDPVTRENGLRRLRTSPVVDSVN
jgi:anti-sigma-K factor RskA